MKKRNLIFNKLVNLPRIFTVLSGNLSAFGQVKSGSKTVSSNQTKQAAQKCSGAWTGTVSYTRTQSMSDNKTTKRVSGRGEDTREWQMKYAYKATVAVTESPERNGSSVGKGKVTRSFSSIEKNSAVEKKSCARGKTSSGRVYPAKVDWATIDMIGGILFVVFF